MSLDRLIRSNIAAQRATEAKAIEKEFTDDANTRRWLFRGGLATVTALGTPLVATLASVASGKPFKIPQFLYPSQAPGYEVREGKDRVVLENQYKIAK